MVEIELLLPFFQEDDYDDYVDIMERGCGVCHYCTCTDTECEHCLDLYIK